MSAKVLILEDDQDLADMIQLFVESEFFVEVLAASSGNKGAELLKAHPNIQVVISDINMPDGDGYDAFAEAARLRHQAKFIFCTANDPDAVARKLGSSAGNVRIVSKPNFMAPLQAALAEIFGPATRVPAEAFCPVNVSLLLRMGVVPSALFVKLSEEKFVRVSGSGEHFTAEDARRYLEKKVTRLYLEKGEAIRLTNELVRMLQVLAAEPEALEMIARAQSGALNAAHDFLEAFGVSEATFRLISANVGLTQKFLQRHRGDFPDFSRLFEASDGYFANHSVLLAYVSGILAKVMKWDSELTLLKLSFAAVLHDISLSSAEISRIFELQEKAAAADPGLVFEPDLRHFMEHPHRSARILSGMKDVPLETDTLVLQHHEAPDGSGYPSRIHHSRMSPLTALLVYGADLADFLLAAGPEKPQKAALGEFCCARAGKYDVGIFRKIHAEVARVAGSSESGGAK